MVSNITYTIEVGGIARNFTKIPIFGKQLKTDTCTSFNCTIEYDDANPVDYWDIVEIKKNDIVVWKGFVETINPHWDETGIFQDIGGRDNSLILWKKFNENFTNMHKGTDGFFGSVNPTELIKFLLRCPKSDLPNEYDVAGKQLYPYNKSGWGIDVSKISSITASNVDSAVQQLGDPTTLLSRKMSMGWKNSGIPQNVDLLVTSEVSSEWLGIGSTPYIDTSDDANYINSNNVVNATAVYQIDNLSATASTIKFASVTVVWRPQPTPIPFSASLCRCEISTDGGSSWTTLNEFGTHNPPWFGPNPWRTYTFVFWGASSLSPSAFRGNNVRLRFTDLDSATGWTVWGNTGTEITQAYVTVVYDESGKQDVGDKLTITLTQEEEIMGIYLESRADTNCFPLGYVIESVSNEMSDFTTFTIVDPTKVTATETQITIDAYKNRDTYVYKDFTAGYFNASFHMYTQCTISAPIPEPTTPDGEILGIWALSNNVDDLYGLWSSGYNHLALYVWKDPDDIINGGDPCFILRENYSGATYEDVSPVLTAGTIYTFNIERSGTGLTVTIYAGTTKTLFTTLHLTLHSGTYAYRYLFSGITSNTSSAIHTVAVIDYMMIETTEELVSVTGNTYRDIIHSWSPKTMSKINIRITQANTASAWGITQVYLYGADDLDYRVWYEEGTEPSFPLEQYIQAVTFDSTPTEAIGPINIPEGRLLETIYNIVQKLNESYVPYDVWMGMDDDNTIHIKNVRGTDKSATINFQLALNLSSNSYSKSVQDTAQRIKISGSGEGKTNDEVSSNFEEDVPATVHSWYEDIISMKDVSDYTMAKSIAQIQLLINKNPKEQIRFDISKDDYAPLAYDVGDTVTITDSLLGLATTTKIYNIDSTVDEQLGEQITITCGAPYEDVKTTWRAIFERLKTLERVGVIKADWVEQGTDSSAVDPTALATMFEATGQNDEQDAGTQQDVQWFISYSSTNLSGARGNDVWNSDGTYQSGKTPVHNMDFALKGTNGYIKGPYSSNAFGLGDGNMHYYLVERRYDDCNDGNDEFHDITIAESPKMVIEIKLFATESGGSPTAWIDGDTLDFGFKKAPDGIVEADPLDGTGYWFRIKCEGEGIFNVYACWDGNDDDGTFITTIVQNVRYRYEIITDPTIQWVYFNVYDVTNNKTIPYTALKRNANPSETVRPFHMCLFAKHSTDPDKQAIAYLYKLKIEYKRVGS